MRILVTCPAKKSRVATALAAGLSGLALAAVALPAFGRDPISSSSSSTATAPTPAPGTPDKPCDEQLNPAGLPAGQGSPPPVPQAGTAPASIISELAVLRRARTRVDVLPQSVKDGQELGVLDRYDPRAVRQLSDHPAGRQLLLVIGRHVTIAQISHRCLRGLSRSDQAAARGESRHRLRTNGQPTACLLALNSGAGTATQDINCFLASTIAIGRAAALLQTYDRGTFVRGLAPDGTAAVRLGNRAGQRVTAPVSANAFYIPVPLPRPGPFMRALRRLEHRARHHTHQLVPTTRQLRAWRAQLFRHYFDRAQPSELDYLDATGHLLRRVPAPFHLSTTYPRPAETTDTQVG